MSGSGQDRAKHGGARKRPAAVRRKEPDPLESAAFEVPTPPTVVVPRPRLEELLDKGTEGPLTLVSSPAGTGKTVLVSSWASGADTVHRVVWVALRDATIGPEAFWPLVLTGLARRGVEVPGTVPGAPDNGEPTYPASIPDAIRSLPVPVVLVLDCDGVLGSEVTEGLDALLRQTGDGLRLVLLTREDPLLPLHRYRLAGTLTELRMADLAFTSQEARSLLSGLGLDLSESAMDAVMRRTQGWAAGLRMAGMSIVHRADGEEAARRLAGDTGTVAEYLLAEVLDTQPPGVRELLLDTSVVDVLRPGLASALAGPQAERALSFLVHGNVFLEELQESVGSYCYHHLFRQLLRAQLAFESPARWVEQHRVAANWFAAHGMVGDAARHAALIDDWELAARYIVDDLAVVSILIGRPSKGLSELVAELPRSADGIAVPVVTAARALACGDLKGALAALRRARELAPTEESWPAAELATTVVELVLARLSGDSHEAQVKAAAAQELISIQDPARLAAHPEIEPVVRANLGVALALDGRLDAAAEALDTFATGADVTGGEDAHIDALGHGALLAAWRGDLTRGADLAVRAVRLSAAASLTPAPCPAAAEVALAYVDAERYELAGARQHAKRAAAYEPPARDPLQTVMLALTRARIMRAGGDLDGAERILSDLSEDRLPSWLRVELDLARATVRAVSTDSTASPELVGAQLAQLSVGHGCNAVSTKVTTLLQSATELLESGHEQTALRGLDRALRFAAPEQSRRAFREAPDELWQLLRRHPQLWSRHAWLTDRRPGGAGRTVPRPRPTRSRGVSSADAPRLYEPLTEKESEVLGHLSELLTTEEIAAVMFISVNTVRTHVRNILRKLAVSRRNEAVRRARELKLVRS